MLGSGAAIVVLKRLVEAVRDGDTIYAVIMGSAVNNDGAAKVGYTAPSVDGPGGGHRRDALAVAGWSADTIGYVEAHGTGTALGDPIEIAALTRGLPRDHDRRQFCAHRLGQEQHRPPGRGGRRRRAHQGGAGAAARDDPAQPQLRAAEPADRLRRQPVLREHGAATVASEPIAAPRGGQLVRCRRHQRARGARGGAAAEPGARAAPAAPAGPDAQRQVPGRARADEPRELADHLEAHPEAGARGRRLYLPGRARTDAAPAVVRRVDAEDAVGLSVQPDPLVVSDRLTAGDGAGWRSCFPARARSTPAWGPDLYRAEPVFRPRWTSAPRILAPLIGRDLLEVVLPRSRTDSRSGRGRAWRASLAQPATFAIQYALARLWMSWGVQPSVMVGHSMGEFVAACLGGVFSLEDALRLVAARGRLMEEQPAGAMLAIMLDADSVSPLLDDRTALAAINAPAQCVASGPEDSITRLEQRLLADDVEVQRLPIALAAHSPMMDPMVDEFRELVRGAARGALRVPMVSTVTGAWATEEQLADPDYWAVHVRQTVRFSDAARRLLDQPDLILIEVGPGQTLSSLVRRQPAATADRAVLTSLRHRRQEISDEESMLRALGQVWGAGGTVDWVAVNGGRRRLVSLPTYPFDHERHWIDPVPATPTTVTDSVPARAAGSAPEPVSVPVHEPASRAEPPILNEEAPEPLVGSRRDRIAARLAAILSELSGVDPSALDPAASFADLGFDSLFLTQANAQFRKQFGVRITFRQIFEEAPSIDSLAGFIDSRLAPDAFPAPERQDGEAPGGRRPGAGFRPGRGPDRSRSRRRRHVHLPGRAAHPRAAAHHGAADRAHEQRPAARHDGAEP